LLLSFLGCMRTRQAFPSALQRA